MANEKRKLSQNKYYAKNKKNWKSPETKAVGKAWREKNKEHLKAYNKKWKEEHPDYHIERYKKNPEKYRKYAIEWKNSHREAVRERDKKCRAKRLKAGKCTACSADRMPTSNFYCEKHWFHSIAGYRFGSRVGGPVLHKMMKDQDFTCPYTGEKLIPCVNCELDHIFPVSKYPDKAADFDNVEFVLKKVNRAKTNMTPDEFIDLCKRVVEYTSEHPHK